LIVKQATLLLLGTIGSLVAIGVSRAHGAEAVTGAAADSITVRSLDKGGMVTVQKGYQAKFGSSKLTAERAVGFSPNGVLWSRDRLENVVIEGGGLAQPLFMPAATLGSTTKGEPMLVSDSVATAIANVIVTYTCSAHIVYANGVSTGQKSVCLGANFVVTCTDDDGHVVTIHTQEACINN
jgi:hypothetical protein